MMSLAKIRKPSENFWQGKNVLITGDLGFKGKWLTTWLNKLGSNILGIDRKSALKDSFLESPVRYSHITADLLSDFWQKTVRDFKPDVIFHFAANALVKDGYVNPEFMIDNNLRSTTNLVKALKQFNYKSLLIVATTDKVYLDKSQMLPHTENDELGANDPYALSKVFVEKYLQISSDFSKFKTVIIRSGNVIGGGDFAANRLIPDIFRAWESGNALEIRNLQGVRPWMHILDSLNGYLLAAEYAFANQHNKCEIFNLAPKIDEQVTVENIIRFSAGHLNLNFERFCKVIGFEEFYERKHLSIDSTKARNSLGWDNVFSWEVSLMLTLDWYTAWSKNHDSARELAEKQIKFFSDL
jgi:CDP-glucose 4,6-dehydratase